MAKFQFKPIVAAFVLSFLTALPLAASAPAKADTLSDVRDRGLLRCGVINSGIGLSELDQSGRWQGFFPEFCRFLAASVLGNADAVEFVEVNYVVRFDALNSGAFDVLMANTTWTLTRDTSLGLNFAGVNYYDGQGFMIRTSMDINSALELSGASICTNTGTTTELNVADYFRANNMDYELVAFEKADEVVAAYDAGRCDVYTTDASGLYAQRLKLTNPGEHKVLP